jgi:hypothetical protein
MKNTNKWGLPAIFERAVGAPRKPVVGRFSATDISAPPYQRVLKERHWESIEQDIRDMMFMLMGTAFHMLMEQYTLKSCLKEYHTSAVHNGVTISGVVDCYDTINRTIIDYKTTSATSIMYNEGPKPEWVKQLNIYRTLLEAEGYIVDKMKIVAIARDWNQAKAGYDRNYPKTPILEVEVPKIDTWAMVDEWLERYNNATPCSDEEKWFKPGKYAVMKKGVKRAVKLYDKEEDAHKHVGHSRDNLTVEYREGSYGRCEGYCNVANVCPCAGGLDENL